MTVPAALLIGTFDGVHVGHAHLVRCARRDVGPAGRVTVLSFDPHPLTVLAPSRVPSRLSLFRQRSRWLRACGADDVIALKPTPELLARSAEQFLQDVVTAHHPSVIVEGHDFHFGKGREGNVAMLRALERRHGYRAIIVGPFECALADHTLARASSRLIRWALMHGRVRDAMLMLGRPFEVEAEVIRGDQRGRTLNMPTANLDMADYVMPADGVYAGWAVRECDPTRTYPAAISVGTKPTFSGRHRACEVHLCGFEGPLDEYGWTIRLQFTEFVRDQLRFNDVDALRAQMQRDRDCVLECTVGIAAAGGGR